MLHPNLSLEIWMTFHHFVHLIVLFKRDNLHKMVFHLSFLLFEVTINHSLRAYHVTCGIKVRSVGIIFSFYINNSSFQPSTNTLYQPTLPILSPYWLPLT